MANRQRFSEPTQDRMVADYLSGMSLNAVGTKFGCCLAVVRNVLLRRSIPRRSPVRAPYAITPENQAIALRLWQEGKPYHRIARTLGVAPMTVTRFLKAQGMTVSRRGAFRENHWKWRGGEMIDSQGYVLTLVPRDSPFAAMANNGYVKKHRLVMAQILNRPLTRHETVHHINGDKTDNSPANLQLRQGRHGAGTSFRCLDCGSANVRAVSL